MQYISTRGQAPAVSFKKALFTGLAPDGGLYVPNQIPFFSPSGIIQLKYKSYVGLAIEVIYPFVAEDIHVREFSRIMNNSIKVFPKYLPPSLDEGAQTPKKFPENPAVESLDDKNKNKIHPVPAPLHILDDNLAIMELFHGPTLAFKDFAIQLLAGLMDYFLQTEKRKILILGATSGDTGSAAIEAFRHYPDIKIVILHPHNKITPFQRQQMTTTGADNIWNLAIEGNFDDCQQLVKDCFNSREFIPNNYNLTAVNSINWARIVAQIVYYFSAFFQAGCNFNRKYCIVVPTGNFGNVLSAYYAKCMGLPIDKFLVSVNENDILHRFFSEKDYRITQMKPSLSPSMDILVSSNLERLIYLLGSPFQQKYHIINTLFLENIGKSAKSVNRMMKKFKDKKKLIVDNYIWRRAKDFFLSATCNNRETVETISKCYKDYKVVVDPHTAVGLKAALSFREQSPYKEMYNIVMATAHPTKFTDALKKAKVPIPPDPRDVDKIGNDSPQEKFEIFPNDLDKLKDYLLSQVLR